VVHHRGDSGADPWLDVDAWAPVVPLTVKRLRDYSLTIVVATAVAQSLNDYAAEQWTTKITALEPFGAGRQWLIAENGSGDDVSS